MKIGHHDVNDRVFIVAEIGINHNGDAELAARMIEAAADAGADAVKFQVGRPRTYVKEALWDVPRETPWGVMPYIQYRERMELRSSELGPLRAYAQSKGLVWFYSPLDVSPVGRLDVPVYKIASPMVTDACLLRAVRDTGKPVIVSSGMTTPDELDGAVDHLDYDKIAILHCTSEYPCPPEHTNLRRIAELQKLYPGRPIGFSSHSKGIVQSIAAVALGARIVEAHLTLDRAMWGSDQAASLEPEAFRRMVREIRTVEASLGDGRKVVYGGERVNMAKFRKDPVIENARSERRRLFEEAEHMLANLPEGFSEEQQADFNAKIAEMDRLQEVIDGRAGPSVH